MQKLDTLQMEIQALQHQLEALSLLQQATRARMLGHRLEEHCQGPAVPQSMQGLQALLQVYQGEVPVHKMWPSDDDFHWARWKWQGFEPHLPPCTDGAGAAGSGGVMEVEESQEHVNPPQAAANGNTRQLNRTSTSHQEEDHRSREAAALPRQEEEEAMREAMQTPTQNYCLNTTKTDPALKVSVTSATLDGGRPRHEGVAVKVGEPLSITIHLVIIARAGAGAKGT